MSELPTDWIFFLFVPVAFVVVLTARYWRFVGQWFEGIRGRDWATISALIDVVSTVVQTEQGRYGERVIGYLATLTYFYHNPDLQMGEYSRMFDLESEAQAWAASYKGKTVMVHVDPRDPSRSVLRKEDL
jgi:hypothetical protein